MQFAQVHAFSSVKTFTSRLARLFACLAAFAVASPAPAVAGSYQMTSQTGATVTDVTGSWDYSYDPYIDGYGGYDVGGSRSGEIATVYTWQPDGLGDDPPQQVVVEEQCQAYRDGIGDNDFDGSCDDGLDDVASYDYEPYPPGGYIGGGNCQGTRYQIKPGGPTVTITCSRGPKKMRTAQGMSPWCTM